MGKGIIKSGGDDGLYNVELTLHRERIDATIAIIDAQIVKLDAKISEMETEILILEMVIWAMPEGNEKEKKKKELQVLVDKKDLEKLKRASYQKRKDYINDNMPEDPAVSAWCGDLTEDLSGNVGTVEIPGERGIVQIQPGYESNAVYNKTRDAQLQPAIAGTPESTCYNLAMLPGWQKWMPTYRHGIISNIDTDNDTCDVMLYADKSSQQGLSINQESKLSGISIEYMSCNASAFEDGDSVLVQFDGQEWSGAKVVGFKDNPKPCEVRIKLYRGDGILLTGYYGGPNPGDLVTWLYLFNSDGDWIPQTITYDEESGYWTLTVDNAEDKDPKGYWIDYDCKRGLGSQYPYIYKNKWQDADLIKGGKFVDIIPYSHVSLFMTPSEDDCYAGLTPSYINNAEKRTTNKLSVSYDVKYTIKARSASVGPNWCNVGCMGVGWILEAFDLSFGPIQDTWEWSDTSTTELSNSPTVELPLSVATEIAVILSANDDPDWDAFNAQFLGIVVGEGGIGERTHIAYYKRSGSAYEIRAAAWRDIETIPN